MRTRSLAAIPLSLSIFSLAPRADAAGAWVANAPLAPVEQRVAIAAGPQRTTVWTSLRFTQPAAGTVAIVVPAPEGSALDLSSDAWFEALEVATAPRVLPPLGVESSCPGAPPGSPTLLEIAGHVEHAPSLKVEDVSVLDSAEAVKSWAAQAGLSISPWLAGALASQGPGRFVALRFQAPEGPSVTPTLRLSTPGAPPLLPLALVRAGSQDLELTTFFIGEGRAKLSGSFEAGVPAIGLRWDAAAKKSDYLSDRKDALVQGGAGATLLESAGHEALGTSLSIAGGKASIESVLVSFFERASAYGDASESTSACLIQAASSLSSSSTVAGVCPRAYLGVIDGGAACVESVEPGEIDPATLRCGGLADDLAVALSDLVPSETWLSRQSMRLPAGESGADWYVSFVAAEAASPVRFAASVDLSSCEGGSSGASSSSSGTVIFDDDAGVGNSSSSASGSGSSGSGSYGSGPYDDGYEGGGSGGYIAVDTTSCSCAGTSDTATDSGDSGCSGSSDTGGDVGSCDGSAGDGSADACSGDSSGSSGCDSSGGSGDMSCSGGGGGGDVECSIFGAGMRRGRAPKLSVMAMLAAALLAPLRRRGRKARAAKARAAKARAAKARIAKARLAGAR